MPSCCRHRIWNLFLRDQELWGLHLHSKTGSGTNPSIPEVKTKNTFFFCNILQPWGVLNAPTCCRFNNAFASFAEGHRWLVGNDETCLRVMNTRPITSIVNSPGSIEGGHLWIRCWGQPVDPFPPCQRLWWPLSPAHCSSTGCCAVRSTSQSATMCSNGDCAAKPYSKA